MKKVLEPRSLVPVGEVIECPLWVEEAATLIFDISIPKVLNLVCAIPLQCHEKTDILHMRKHRRRSAKLISAFVFAT